MYQRGKMVQRREAKGYSAPDEDAVSLEISDRKTAQDAPAPLPIFFPMLRFVRTFFPVVSREQTRAYILP